MPLLKHAKKKLKQDKKRAILNKKVKNAYKLAVKTAKEKQDAKSVSAAFQAIDKASKKSMMHKNKAARMKSSLSKLLSGLKSKTGTTSSAATSKTANAKPSVKKAVVKKSAAKIKTKKASTKKAK